MLWGVEGGALSDSLGFTLKGRQKPLCVQALTSSSTSHPTRPGPFKKKKKNLLQLWVGVRASMGLRGKIIYVCKERTTKAGGGWVGTVGSKWK